MSERLSAPMRSIVDVLRVAIKASRVQLKEARRGDDQARVRVLLNAIHACNAQIRRVYLKTGSGPRNG